MIPFPDDSVTAKNVTGAPNSKTKRTFEPTIKSKANILITRTGTDQHHASDYFEVLHLSVREKETKAHVPATKNPLHFAHVPGLEEKMPHIRDLQTSMHTTKRERNRKKKKKKKKKIFSEPTTCHIKERAKRNEHRKRVFFRQNTARFRIFLSLRKRPNLTEPWTKKPAKLLHILSKYRENKKKPNKQKIRKNTERGRPSHIEKIKHKKVKRKNLKTKF